MDWNTNIDEAPRGYTSQVERIGSKGKTYTVDQFAPDVIMLSTKCKQVIQSRWIPETDKALGRWLGLATGEQPEAWQFWPDPYEVE